MELLGTLSGGAQIAAAMSTAMAPHPPLGWSHHITYDHLVSRIRPREPADDGTLVAPAEYLELVATVR
jgi:hypothetical protein